MNCKEMTIILHVKGSDWYITSHSLKYDSAYDDKTGRTLNFLDIYNTVALFH